MYGAWPRFSLTAAMHLHKKHIQNQRYTVEDDSPSSCSEDPSADITWFFERLLHPGKYETPMCLIVDMEAWMLPDTTARLNGGISKPWGNDTTGVEVPPLNQTLVIYNALFKFVAGLVGRSQKGN
jgi:hypothetical protein